MTADEKYAFLNRDNLTQPIQVQLSKKEKTFSNWLAAFLKFGLNFESCEKKMTLIAYLFLKLQAEKDVVRQMYKKSSFTRPFNKKHIARSQTLLKCSRQHLYHIYWPLWRKLSSKKSLIVICKFLRLFVDTLTADGKYSRFNRDNLRQPIQMQLSKKQKTF